MTAQDSVKTSTVSYTLDPDDVIVEVSSSWQSFAKENFAVGLTDREVVGRPLWDFIKDDSTRSLYKALLKAVRAKGQPISFPFRCDSPRIRRYMVMNVLPQQDGRVVFANELVETRSRSPEVYFQNKVGANKNYYVMCSVCNKVRPYEDDGEWQEVEDAFAAMAHMEEPVQLVYEVCEPCSASVQTSLEQYDQLGQSL